MYNVYLFFFIHLIHFNQVVFHLHQVYQIGDTHIVLRDSTFIFERHSPEVTEHLLASLTLP